MVHTLNGYDKNDILTFPNLICALCFTLDEDLLENKDDALCDKGGT